MNPTVYFIGLWLISLGLVGGQLLHWSVLGVPLTGLDAAVWLWAIVCLIEALAIRRRHYPINSTVVWAGLFASLGLVALVGALRWIDLTQVVVASFYLWRWVAYASLIWFGYQLRGPKYLLLHRLGLVFGLVALLGIIQLWLIPNIGFLERFGWDPHQQRLVSTFLDPNLVGGFLVLGFALAVTQLLRRDARRLPWHLWYWGGITLLTAVTTYLTFSRSALLALVVAVAVISFLRYRWLAIALAVILTSVYLLSPRLQMRIQGALELDQTAKYRLISWSEGLNILRHEPWLGVGFNTLSVTRSQYGYWPAGRADSGFDSSLLTVAATTGWLGLAAYLGLILSGLGLAWRKYRVAQSDLALGFIAGTVALLVHSLFVNSLLYPAIMAAWWIILGLVWAI